MSGGSPYQGFAFQYKDGNIKIQANNKSVGEALQEWGKTSGAISFTRVSEKLYYDNNYLLDYSTIARNFTAPLSFGANIDNSGNPRRYSKVDLSDMEATLKYSYSELMNLTLPTPYKTGYTFDGWYTEETGGTKITSPTLEQLGNKTIYAHWQATNYFLTFNANGGTGTMPNQSGFTYGVFKALQPNTFTKTGYVFVGWNTKANGTGFNFADEEQVVNLGNITLYAQWTLSTLVVQPGGEDASFLGGPITKNEIESVTISNSIAEANNTKYDVSTDRRGTILCWYTDIDADGLYEVTIGSTWGKVIANPNSSNLFAYIGYNENSDDTTCIYGIENLDTTIVKNMSYMFYNCGYRAMTDLDLGDNFDTSNVTNMKSMFESCGYTALTSLDLGDKFDTSSVTNMARMFEGCGYTAMTSLDIRSMIFDTNKLTDYTNIFTNSGKQNDCTVYINQAYETFVTNNRSSRWSIIVPVTI